ncbi:sigma-70 RNA polymerase sigma factor region 4 domain-containing protein [Leuconostoc palmae]|uniref:sigma-70 family RNA polymerase sigma factor n=1 Tax=Leuconostoc palmae TaxID=501487 RepID=UPI001C7E0C92|nr:sigma-70 family RNA polymerase sigma factor [Leuconostoc palmae]
MAKDRLVSVVRAAQKGHDVAYDVLIKHLKGAVFDIHRRKVSSRMTADEWYSDGLNVLIKCVNKFDTDNPRAKFSTYFISALSNHATDLVRSYYTAKADFEKNLLSDNSEDYGYHFEQGTDTYNPEELYILRELLQQTEVARTPEFCQAIRHFLGVEHIKNIKSSRRLEQMQYRLKKSIRSAINSTY